MSTENAAQAFFIVDGRAVALALLQRRGLGLALRRIIIGLAVGAALADRKRARGPGCVTKFSPSKPMAPTVSVNANTTSAKRRDSR